MHESPGIGCIRKRYINPHNWICSWGHVFKLLPGSPLRGKLLQARVRLELWWYRGGDYRDTNVMGENCTDILGILTVFYIDFAIF